MMDLYNGDCLEVMRSIANNSIDLVATDCPYKIVSGGCRKIPKDGERETSGILTHRHKDNKRTDWVDAVRTGKMFANNDIEFKDWLPDVYRILKDKSHCYIMVNSRNLAELQKQSEKVGFKFQNLLMWDKGNVTPNRWYMQGFECILMLRKGGAKNINNLGSSNILKVPNIIGNKTHPTEKPIDLMRILIENSTQPNEIVLDPFMGSGTTAIACKSLGLDYIGSELDKDYFEIIQKRLSSVQGSLF